MKSEGSLLHSQEPATYPYPETDQSSPCLSSSWRSISILSSHLHLCLPCGLYPSGFPNKIMCWEMELSIDIWFMEIVVGYTA